MALRFSGDVTPAPREAEKEGKSQRRKGRGQMESPRSHPTVTHFFPQGDNCDLIRGLTHDPHHPVTFQSPSSNKTSGMFVCLFVDRVCLGSPGWVQTLGDPPTSASQVLGLQPCTTTPGSGDILDINLICYRHPLCMGQASCSAVNQRESQSRESNIMANVCLPRQGSGQSSGSVEMVF